MGNQLIVSDVECINCSTPVLNAVQQSSPPQSLQGAYWQPVKKRLRLAFADHLAVEAIKRALADVGYGLATDENEPVMSRVVAVNQFAGGLALLLGVAQFVFTLTACSVSLLASHILLATGVLILLGNVLLQWRQKKDCPGDKIFLFAMAVSVCLTIAHFIFPCIPSQMTVMLLVVGCRQLGRWFEQRFFSQFPEIKLAIPAKYEKGEEVRLEAGKMMTTHCVQFLESTTINPLGADDGKTVQAVTKDEVMKSPFIATEEVIVVIQKPIDHNVNQGELNQPEIVRHPWIEKAYILTSLLLGGIAAAVAYGLGLPLVGIIHAVIGLWVGACPCSLSLIEPILGQSAFPVIGPKAAWYFDLNGTLTDAIAVKEKRAITEGDKGRVANLLSAIIQADNGNRRALALLKHLQLKPKSVTNQAEPIVEDNIKVGYYLTSGSDRWEFRRNKSNPRQFDFKKNNQQLASYELESPLMPAAVALLKQLQRDGHAVTVLSGSPADSPEVTALETALSGLNLQTSLTAEQKKEAIDPNRMSVMVGDGMNDRAAMHAAKIAIALGPAKELLLQTRHACWMAEGCQQILAEYRSQRLRTQHIRWGYGLSMAWSVVSVALSIALAASLSASGPAIMALGMLVQIGIVLINKAVYSTRCSSAAIPT